MNKKAFTLLELGVVTVIIGLLVAGIIKGSSIVSSSRIAAARFLTQNSNIGAIDGLVAWYETSSYDSFLPAQAVDNGQISEWRDISPASLPQQKNKLTRTASASVIYKYNGINKIPSISFSSSGILTLSAFYQGTSSQYTVFLVFSPLTATGSTQLTLLDSHSSGSTSSIGVKNNAVSLNAGSAVDTGTGSNAASFASTGNYVVAAYFDGASSRAYSNNADTSAGAANISAGTNQLAGLTIGATKAAGTAFTGYISEIIIFNKVLDINRRKEVMGYLSKKYKIPVTGTS